MSTIDIPPVNRIAVTQLLIALLLAAVAYLFDKNIALSVILGAAIQIGPQAYFTRMAYKHTGARQAPRVLRGFYQGVSGKLILTAVLFAIVFSKFQGLNYPAVFLSYLAMIVVHGLSAVTLLKK